MEELARWDYMNTTITVTEPAGPFAAMGGGMTTVEFPDSKETNSKAKSLCLDVFREW